MAASDKQLGELHALVATVLSVQLQQEEVNTAAINAAIAFLKNNNITADPTQNAELLELNNKLAARRQKAKTDLNTALKEVDGMIVDHYSGLTNMQ